jgi:imidazolonepropionase
MTHVDLLISHASQLITRSPQIISDGAIAIHQGVVVSVGPSSDLFANFTATTSINATGKTLLPGFVDSHTHIVYAGDRLTDFEMRLQGAAYLDILAAGGGIVSTTRKVRAAAISDLVEQTLPRLQSMLRHGTTTAEIKTGYGLDTASELKMLQAIEELTRLQPITLVPTFLAAHAVPPEFKNRPDGYVDLVVDTMIPEAAAWYRSSSFSSHKIPFFIDVFCEQNAFSLAQSRRVLEAGIKHGMLVKAHVDEFVNLGGSLMASSLGAVSIDHLDATTPEQISQLAQSSTVCVAIPAVNFHLGNAHYANARAMIDAGATVALATDFNPGSAPCPSMQFVMALACRYQKLLPAEALLSATLHGARAVALADSCGSLEPGKWADILIADTADYRDLAYQFGGNLITQVIKKGNVAWSRN